MIGALSNVFFYAPDKGIAGNVQLLAIEAAKGNPDLIIPMFIREALPSLVLYLFSLTMLSAAMSTMSSLFHVTGSSLGHDIYRSVTLSGADSITITRIGIICGIVVSVLFAIVLPPGIVARGTAIFFGVCAAAFLPSYVAALYWKNATKAGVFASIITGVAASLAGLCFFHVKESAALGICKALFGRDVLITAHPWPVVDPFIYSFPLAIIVLIAVSLCTKKPGEALVKRCFPDTTEKN
jgi:SSS family solute:Na+ symporter